MNIGSIENPSSQPQQPKVEKVQPQISLPFSSLPPPLSADTSTSSKSINFSPSKAPVDDHLLQEIDVILNKHATYIEKELENLEKHKSEQELLEGILETESWAAWSQQFCNSTKENVQNGLEFLEHVLPHKLLENLPSSSQLEGMGRILALSGAFLTALDSGTKGLALLCRSKILRRSEELLQEMQKIEASGDSSQEQLETVRQLLKEWETNLFFEKESFAEEKTEFALNTASSILLILSTPLTYIPKEVILEHVKIAAEIGLSGIMSGLELAIGGWELYKSHKESKVFHQWIQAYQSWQKRHLPRFKLTETGMQREETVSSSLVSLPLTQKAHEAALFKFFNEAKDLSEIRNYLKDFNIKLDSSWQSKEEFLSHLETNFAYRFKLVWSYLHVQRSLEALDVVIHTSQDLLEKRRAISQKKILLLKPHFHTVEAKIKEMKKQLFIQDMQNVLWEQMRSSHGSPSLIKQQLQKWGFYHPQGNKQHQKVLQALRQFESAKSPKATLEQKENLIKEFYQWMEHPTAMDEQFQAWYATQSQDTLLQFYVDHQETIENTTKNALKEMVQKKHAIESRFIQFKLNKSRIQFSIATIALVISVTLTILGLVSLPFGGAALILLGISLGSSLISLGFLGAGFYQAYREKPNATKTLSPRFQLKMTWAKLRTAIETYAHQSKEKKLLEVAKVLYKLQMLKKTNEQNEKDYQKALADYVKAKEAFTESQKKMNKWSKRLKKLEDHLAKKSWQDFARQAALQINSKPAAFDSLQAFQKAFEACDFRLLNEETKHLLEVQLGLDLEHLQAQVNKDPESIKDTLREFFVLGDTELVSFIKKAHLKKRVRSLSGHGVKNHPSSFKIIFKVRSSFEEKQHGS